MTKGSRSQEMQSSIDCLVYDMFPPSSVGCWQEGILSWPSDTDQGRLTLHSPQNQVRKAQILAIFDDLDTILLMIPLKMRLGSQCEGRSEHGFLDMGVCAGSRVRAAAMWNQPETLEV